MSLTKIAKGCDISKHNGTINWDVVDTDEIQFVIIRAGFGFNTKDPMFETYIKGVIKRNIPIGIYWFSYAGNVEQAIREAKGCIDIIKPYKEYIKLPVFFDWEEESNVYVKRQYGITSTKATVSALTEAWCKPLEIEGFKTGIYSSKSYLENLFNDQIKKTHDIWVAHVADGNGNPLEVTTYKGDYALHQYSWVGKPKGFNANTDMNYCYKAYDCLLKNSSEKDNSVESSSVNPTTDTSATTSTSPKTSTITPATVQSVDKDRTKAQGYSFYIPQNITFLKDDSKNVVSVYNYNTHKNTYVSNHFQVKEFADKITEVSLYSVKVKIHNKLIIILESLFERLGCSMIIINSGYRTSAHEKKIGNSNGVSYHTKGRAADITCYDKNRKPIAAETVCIELERMGIYGIGYISKTAVHIDTRPAKEKWFGDETKTGQQNILKCGYSNWFDYFKSKNKS